MSLPFPKHSDTGAENPALYRAQRYRQPTTEDASYLAHDTRNWLTVLRVYSDLLRSSGAIAPGYELWMEELAGAIERGQGLVEGLLDSLADGAETNRSIGRSVATANVQSIAEWHSMRAARRKLASTESIDLTAALSRRLPMLRRMAGEKITVELYVPAHEVPVSLSEEDFERVLYNLVLNSIQAMPAGGTLRLDLLCEGSRRDHALSSEKAVLLRVSDSGVGIEPNLLPRIFERGISKEAAPSSHSRHRGLGLAIVRELTERAGGKVRVRSKPGNGSQFEVELPTTT